MSFARSEADDGSRRISSGALRPSLPESFARASSRLSKERASSSFSTWVPSDSSALRPAAAASRSIDFENRSRCACRSAGDLPPCEPCAPACPLASEAPPFWPDCPFSPPFSPFSSPPSRFSPGSPSALSLPGSRSPS